LNKKQRWYQSLGIPHHEYWPWYLMTLPIVPAWVLSMLRMRSITYFTAVNPSIEDGGFIDESKIAINNLMPDKYLPYSLVGKPSYSPQELKYLVKHSALQFPFIAKPDKGGRGKKVSILNSETELAAYHLQMDEPYLMQELIDYPLELSIFYYYYPITKQFDVISIVAKEYLSVIGNGADTVANLLKKDYRGAKQVARLLQSKAELLQSIPAAGTELIVEPIGNHIRGTIFRSYNHKITQQLKDVVLQLVLQCNQLYYGRFDLKVSDWESLYKGENIKILEFNGVGADLAHIYDPNMSYRQAIKDQWGLASIMAKVAKESIALGNTTTPLKIFFQKLRRVIADLNA
jgi:hypothetical protein